MELAQFASVIQKGASSPENDVRELAEHELMEFRENFPREFIKYSVQLICDARTELSLRVMSASILNMSLRETNLEDVGDL